MFEFFKSPRLERDESEDDRKFLANTDGDLMSTFVVSQVEEAVIKLENQLELQRSSQSLNSSQPDYSWLISDKKRPKKYLTVSERYKVEDACDRVQNNEWSQVLATWSTQIQRAENRDEIIKAFLSSVHAAIVSRSNKSNVAEALKHYVRSGSTMSAVGDVSAEPIRMAFGSTRSLGDVRFLDASDLV